MNISYNWLKQFLKIDWDSQKIGELLTDLGLEVEGIETYESIKGGLQGIVVGRILNCEKHPNADRLQLTKVDVGQPEPLQIVCGAPNVEAGQTVAVAVIGTTLYTKEGKAWSIRKGKIRGVESHGMICAEDEIGLGESHDGIMVLDEKLIPGTPLSEVFETETDEVFEIGLTPNRADAMSHYGVARDLKAGLKQKEVEKELITPPTSHFNVDNRSLKINVVVENSDLAPRYCGITMSDLIVQPSPTWLKNRLKAIGLKPINNVVDATNYVLHELGQPLHAFDADRIYGKKVVVKTLPKGTKFMTLDGELRELHEDDLMICDGEKPMCIAGVFGGINTGVTENTTSIFLESAYFDPISVRKTAKRHGLNTDASFRFERGIDIENVEYCLKRAALLIKEIAGGHITSDIADFYPKRREELHVFLTFDKINKLIGQEIPQDTIKSILASLDIKVRNVTETGMGLTIPPYRVDVEREVDVIEEILRVYGYNNIVFKDKWNTSIAETSKFEDYKLQDIIANALVAQGFMEIMTNSLSSAQYLDLVNDFDQKESVTMLNPLSTELSVLRQSMLFTGLEALAHNINRKKQNLRFFEFGKTYRKSGSDNKETTHLSLYLTGNKHGDNWVTPEQKIDFYFLKTIVENILKRLGIQNISQSPVKTSVFSEGLLLRSENTDLVSFGLVNTSTLKGFDIKQEVLYADFNWADITTLLSKTEIAFKNIPKFQEVKRDFALLLDNDTTFKEVYDIGFLTERNLLMDIQLFDVYTGDKLPQGKKSYAVSFTLLDNKKTLTDKQIDKIMTKLRGAYETQLGAELR